MACQKIIQGIVGTWVIERQAVKLETNRPRVARSDSYH
jgi:hypothetical protein